MMDWLVRPLATMFFGGALGGSSGNINLQTEDGRETETGSQQGTPGDILHHVNLEPLY
jgi:hypothetical protein